MASAEAMYKRYSSAFSVPDRGWDLHSDIGRARFLAEVNIYSACIVAEAISNLMNTEIE